MNKMQARFYIPRGMATGLAAAALCALTSCAGERLAQPLPVVPSSPIAGNGCPAWVDFPSDRSSNADSPWLGCVSDANLRAMLEDPSDLQRGRPLGPADGERESLGVESYQADKPKGGQAASVPPATGSSGTQ
jgi:hypothetical protein